ncbi:MAG: Ubiquinone/menaquinone biosynthesis C-methyltransferase UbiE [Anaerolineales bacterium]|nr:Ubiquinone/menaquinone biosynthesis C-methyltransferase UbiE [Anaerolineales bacterium]
MSDEQQRKIYQTDGDRYEALIAREDHQGNIEKALDEIVRVEGLDALDLGAGTGRLAVMLASRVRSIKAFDISSEMLRVCRQRLEASGLSNWQVDIADHRQLPITNYSVDLVVSGWSVSYLAVWNPDTWKRELEIWMSEMRRVIRPNGFIVLFESLGTGNESPVRLSHLENFYQWLDEVGFQNKMIRTDYKFDSLAEAEELSRFFFGDELGEKVRQNEWVILPECTGVWWVRPT